MSRVEALLRLYHLALTAPLEEQPERLAAWMEERQALVDGLRGGQPRDGDRGLERALLALILSADRDTHDHLVKRRRELGALMRRPRPYGPGG